MSTFKADLSILVLKRIGFGLVTLLVVSLIIFGTVELLPGDVAEDILGEEATEEAAATFREELGLDRPPVARYADWLGGAVIGDFGRSFDTGRPVAEQLAPRLGNTLFLALLAAAIAAPLALLIGILAALRRGSIFDRIANIGALTSVSSPEFFVAYVLILFFATLNPVFPSLSDISADMPFWARVERTMLPAITLAVVVAAHMMRAARTAVVDVLASPYIETARLKGAAPRRVILTHALPNALAPVGKAAALNLAHLITGLVVVEAVFAYPGIGRLFADAVRTRDIPVALACCLVFAAAYILLKLLADVVSIVANPRLRASD